MSARCEDTDFGCHSAEPVVAVRTGHLSPRPVRVVLAKALGVGVIFVEAREIEAVPLNLRHGRCSVQVGTLVSQSRPAQTSS